MPGRECTETACGQRGPVSVKNLEVRKIRMKAKIDLLWRVSDILFLAGLAAALFLAGRVTPLLVAAGVLAYFPSFCKS